MTREELDKKDGTMLFAISDIVAKVNDNPSLKVYENDGYELQRYLELAEENECLEETISNMAHSYKPSDDYFIVDETKGIISFSDFSQMDELMNSYLDYFNELEEKTKYKENTYWLVNIPLHKDGYSFMVKMDAKDEEEVLDELKNHLKLFVDESDYDYANVVEATDYDYEAFRKSNVIYSL